MSTVGQETKVKEASENFILQKVLPFSSLSDTGTRVVIQGIKCSDCSLAQSKAFISTCEWRGGGRFGVMVLLSPNILRV